MHTNRMRHATRATQWMIIIVIVFVLPAKFSSASSPSGSASSCFWPLVRLPPGYMWHLHVVVITCVLPTCGVLAAPPQRKRLSIRGMLRQPLPLWVLVVCAGFAIFSLKCSNTFFWRGSFGGGFETFSFGATFLLKMFSQFLKFICSLLCSLPLCRRPLPQPLFLALRFVLCSSTEPKSSSPRPRFPPRLRIPPFLPPLPPLPLAVAAVAVVVAVVVVAVVRCPCSPPPLVVVGAVVGVG
jgi:hypothetical protein